MPRKLKAFIFISLLLPILFLGNNPIILEASQDEEATKLFVGQIKIVSTSWPTRVVISNPEVADVVDVTKSEIMVSAKSPGMTTLVYWDDFGEHSINIKVVKEDMDEIKRRVDNLLAKLNLPEVYTKAEDDEGKVYLLGSIKNPQDKERVALALGTLKDKIVDLIEVKEEEAIVEIDVQVLELDKDATKTLGFTWPGNITLTETGSPGITAEGTKWSTLFSVLNLSRAAFTFTLDALVQQGKARVLSRPRLSCQSGKEAELLVGGEKPIFTTTVAATTGAEGTEVSYKEFGIKLKIKPTVTEKDRLKLALNVEVSEVGTADIIGAPTAPTAKAYPLTKRLASTELFLNDGQTMAIGGLIKQKTDEELRELPWLADIPVLGLFFRQRVTKMGGGIGEKGNTELFITLTPTIVSKEKVSQAKEVSSQEVLPVKKEAEIYQDTTHISPSLANYLRTVQTKILNAIYYPPQAKEAGWEGNLKLGFNLRPNGYLKDIKILQSSGYKILDDTALEIVRAQQPYPPFPPQIDSQELWVEVPIIYKKD